MLPSTTGSTHKCFVILTSYVLKTIILCSFHHNQITPYVNTKPFYSACIVNIMKYSRQRN